MKNIHLRQTSKQNWKNIELHFDASDENLLRSTHEGVLNEHLTHYNSRLIEFIVKNDIKRVLDFGCGDGKVLYAFALMYPNINFVGVDLSEENINLATEKFSAPNISYHRVVGSVNDLSNLGKFDLIFSFSVVQYFDTQSMSILIKQLIDLLNDDGALVHMSIPNLNHFYRFDIPDTLSFVSFFKASVKLLLHSFDKNKRFGGNGYWWSKNSLLNAHNKYFESVCFLSSDSWYRFDLICIGKKN
jgi:2-polyprenyl-3-methyl-5-hydroxy-6-metoxy-1,4-benzoquinol methylase